MNPASPSIHLRHLSAAAAVAAAVVLAFSAVVGHPHVKPVSADEVQGALDALVPVTALSASPAAALRQ